MRNDEASPGGEHRTKCFGCGNPFPTHAPDCPYAQDREHHQAIGRRERSKEQFLEGILEQTPREMRTEEFVSSLISDGLASAVVSHLEEFPSEALRLPVAQQIIQKGEGLMVHDIARFFPDDQQEIAILALSHLFQGSDADTIPDTFFYECDRILDIDLAPLYHYLKQQIAVEKDWIRDEEKMNQFVYRIAIYFADKIRPPSEDLKHGAVYAIKRGYVETAFRCPAVFTGMDAEDLEEFSSELIHACDSSHEAYKWDIRGKVKYGILDNVLHANEFVRDAAGLINEDDIVPTEYQTAYRRLFAPYIGKLLLTYFHAVDGTLYDKKSLVHLNEKWKKQGVHYLEGLIALVQNKNEREEITRLLREQQP